MIHVVLDNDNQMYYNTGIVWPITKRGQHFFEPGCHGNCTGSPKRKLRYRPRHRLDHTWGAGSIPGPVAWIFEDRELRSA